MLTAADAWFGTNAAIRSSNEVFPVIGSRGYAGIPATGDEQEIPPLSDADQLHRGDRSSPRQPTGVVASVETTASPA
jgi:hypothetical protein